MPEHPPDDSVLYGIIASLVSLVGWLAHKVYNLGRRKPDVNGKRISQSEAIAELGVMIANHSAKLDGFAARLFQMELDRDDWNREYGRKLEQIGEEISRVRRRLPRGDLES